jgi:hypothetical protein
VPRAMTLVDIIIPTQTPRDPGSCVIG